MSWDQIRCLNVNTISIFRLSFAGAFEGIWNVLVDRKEAIDLETMYVLGIMFTLLEIRLVFSEWVLKTTTLNSGSDSVWCITESRLTVFYLQKPFLRSHRLLPNLFFFYPPWFRMTHWQLYLNTSFLCSGVDLI